jgi:hypothetical protein
MLGKRPQASRLLSILRQCISPSAIPDAIGDFREVYEGSDHNYSLAKHAFILSRPPQASNN